MSPEPGEVPHVERRLRVVESEESEVLRSIIPSAVEIADLVVKRVSDH
ncbi:MAG: hypothetical protein ACR2LJ_05760 [Acidimicrobiales bacterium]